MVLEHVVIEEVVSAPVDFLGDDQYFIMYVKNEGENFNPEQIFGVWGAKQAAHITSRFRQTGVLLKPSGWRYYNPHRPQEYMVIEDALSIWVLRPTDVLYKTTHIEAMSKKDAEAYAVQQREARKNVTKFIEEEEDGG